MEPAEPSRPPGPRHMRRPWYRGQPVHLGGGPAEEDTGGKRPVPDSSGVSHRTKRLMAGALVVLTLLGVCALVVALVLVF